MIGRSLSDDWSKGDSKWLMENRISLSPGAMPDPKGEDSMEKRVHR